MNRKEEKQKKRKKKLHIKNSINSLSLALTQAAANHKGESANKARLSDNLP